MNSIATIVVLFSCVAFSYQQAANHTQIHEKMKEVGLQCIQTSGVAPDLPKKALIDGDFPNDKNLKCFFKCLLQALGHMNDAGVVELDSLKTKIPAGEDTVKISAAIDKCKGLTGADACETAFNVAKCLRDTIGPIKH